MTTRAAAITSLRSYITALATNLVLNASWSWVFFKWHRLLPATVVAAALAASTADLTRRTAEADPAAGIGLSPYAVWTAFATVLTGRITQLNRGPRHRLRTVLRPGR